MMVKDTKAFSPNGDMSRFTAKRGKQGKTMPDTKKFPSKGKGGGGKGPCVKK